MTDACHPLGAEIDRVFHAEDAAGEALLVALERWPVDGMPPNPGAWLTVTAGNKAIDRIRRASAAEEKHRQGATNIDAPKPTGPVEDDRLRLVFTCCHPGQALVRSCLALNRPGPYQLQAVISAHADALDASMTDWGQVLQLFDQLMALAPGPVVALNRAVALAEVDGPEVALALLDPLALSSYHAWHATRADLLRRLGRYEESRSAYDAAVELAGNDAERVFLGRRRDDLPV